MIKTKLMKALLLGISFSVFSSGIAMAESGGGQSGSFAGVQIEQTQSSEQTELSEQEKALYEKQAEVDKFLFEDHAKEIEEMGFIVTHTVVNGDLIEVGISPFNKIFTDYLYNNLNEDVIHVVEGEEIMMYATSEDVTELAASSGLSESGSSNQETGDDQVSSNDEEKYEIQITSEVDENTEVLSPEDQAIAEGQLAETEQETADEVAPVIAKDTIMESEEDVNNNSIIKVIAIVGMVGILAVVLAVIRKQIIKK